MAKKKAKTKRAAGQSEANPPGGESATFEQSLEQLEQIVADLEGGELGLDAALDRYQRGVATLKACHEQLAQAERRVQLLSGVDAEGNPITEPLDGDSLEDDSLTNKASTRAQRRSRPTAGSSGVDDPPGLF